MGLEKERQAGSEAPARGSSIRDGRPERKAQLASPGRKSRFNQRLPSAPNRTGYGRIVTGLES
jgi:hypothetical protein